MSILNKLEKVLKYIRKYNVIQSIYWYYKLKVPRNASIHIYHNSIVDISDNAIVKINNGELSINDSWFDTNNRRFISEFRIMNGGTYEQNGRVNFFQGASLHVGEGAFFRIKGRCVMNTNSQILCFNKIVIGEDCLISDNVCIVDSDSHCINGNQDNICKPILIGNHVWIGRNVTILKGVEIGDGVIIGACSVVTKSIPSNCLAVGNPARVIKENIMWK